AEIFRVREDFAFVAHDLERIRWKRLPQRERLRVATVHERHNLGRVSLEELDVSGPKLAALQIRRHEKLTRRTGNDGDLLALEVRRTAHVTASDNLHVTWITADDSRDFDVDVAAKQAVDDLRRGLRANNLARDERVSGVSGRRIVA